MNNARQLLDSFLGQTQGSTGGESNTGGGLGAGLGGGLDAIRQQASQVDVNALRDKAGQMDLGSLLSGKGGLIAAAGAGGLAGLLLGGKKPRKVAKTALKVGGVALVGGLAYKAWRDWQANKAPAQAAPAPAPAPLPAPAAPSGTVPQVSAPDLPSPEGTVFLPDSEAEREDLSQHLLRAMIAAAKADGHIDDAERDKIAAQLDAAGLAPEHHAFVRDELAKPLNIAEVVAGATCQERAAEIYAASLLAIDPEGAAEKGYLAMLAARLELDPGLVAHLHANADALTE